MNSFERALLNASTWLVAGSGGAYFYMKYLMTGGGEFSVIHHLALALPMIASGYLVQVVTDPAARRVLAGVHIAGGGLYVLLFAGHLVVSRNGSHRGGSGRRSARRGHSRTPRLDRAGRRGIR